MDLIKAINRRGGLAATHELYSQGATKHALGRAVACGSIIRVRQGWYALPGGDAPCEEAVRVGGRLGCTSAARLHGLWVRDSIHLHVSVKAHDGRLRSRHDKRVRLATLRSPAVTVHWDDVDAAGTRFALGPRECLREMALCQSPERVVAAADSAIRLKLITRHEWMADISALPRRLRRLLGSVEPRSESITESIARFRLQRLGFSPQVQFRVAGVGRVDLLLGRTLVIELDGYEFHSTREAFEDDRRRDAKLAARGFVVLRFSYDQVMNRWSEVRAAIVAAIALGDHLR